MPQIVGVAIVVALSACTSAAPSPPSARPSVSAAASPASTVMGSIVGRADGQQTFTERTGAFAIDYPATWEGGSQQRFSLVYHRPGFPKATFEILPSGRQSYQLPPTTSTMQIPTSIGTLTAYRFKAQGVYGGAPYYAEVISTRFGAGGRDWVVEAVLLEQRRDEMIAIVLDFLRTLRSG